MGKPVPDSWGGEKRKNRDSLWSKREKQVINVDQEEFYVLRVVFCAQRSI